MKDRALIIDDNEASRKIASYLLTKRRMVVIEAQDGEQGVPAILNEKPQLVILDWLMPKLDGSDTLLLSDHILTEIDKLNGTFSERQDKINLVLYTSTRLEDLSIPLTKHFHILGYISKSWPLELQKRKFNYIMRNLNHRRAA